MVYSYGSWQTMEQILEECNSSEATVDVVKKGVDDKFYNPTNESFAFQMNVMYLLFSY